MTLLLSLLSVTVRASLVIACAGALAFALRRASAACRHLIWAAALAGVLLLPLAMVMGPRWSVPVPARPAAAGATATRAGSVASLAPVSLSGDDTSLPPAARLAWRVSRTMAAPSVPTPAVVLALWLLGLLAVGWWFIAGLTRLHRLAGSARPLRDAGWAADLDAARTRLALTRPVHLLSGAAVAVPLTWGTLRPLVLLPDDAAQWTAERRRVVLLHELAHVQRCDCLVQRIAQVVCALHWFNPLVWVAARALARERERACDEQVIACGLRASDYAEQLLSFARPDAGGRWPAAVAMPMARTSNIEARLRTILSPRVPRPPRGAAIPALLTALVGTLVLAVGTVHPAAAQTTAGTSAGSQSASPAPAAPDDRPAQQERHRLHAREARDRKDFNRAMNRLSRQLNQALDHVQPLLDNLNVHVDIRDKNGRPVDPQAIAQAVQGALKGVDFAALARDAAAEASVDMADTISDAVSSALSTLPDALDNLHVCIDDSTRCKPKHRH